MKSIFEQSDLHGLSVKNRLVRSATWEGIAQADGGIRENTYAIYKRLAKGGIGTIITGFTSVDLHDRYFGGMMRLCDDALIPQYKKLVDIVHEQDAKILAQLALGAYYRPLADGRYVQIEPDHMSLQEIKDVEEKFIAAAVRAEKAGFDGVQIHMAHFFFLSRFISPAVNHRTDEYGVDEMGRSRIAVDILKGIKEMTSLHISVKINSDDFTYGGLDEEGSLKICKILAENGIDSIEASGNGTSVAGIRAHVNEGYFVPFAAKLAEEVDVPVICVGGFRSQDFMNEVLDRTKISFLSLSRPLLCEPDLPKKMMEDASYVSKCISCNRCYSSKEHRCIFEELIDEIRS